MVLATFPPSKTESSSAFSHIHDCSLDMQFHHFKILSITDWSCGYSAAICKAEKLSSAFFACLCSAHGWLFCSGLVGFYIGCRCQNTASSVGVVVSFQLISSSAWIWMQNTEMHISLSPFQVNGDIPPRLKKSAHEIILDFIRSRPPLNPVCNPVGFIPNKNVAFKSMFVSREHVKYYVFWHRISKILSFVYRMWYLKRTACNILHYQLAAVITSSPLSLINHYELGKNTILFPISVSFTIKCI